MKPLKTLLTLSVIAFALISCNQTEPVVPANELDATKTANVKKGEPVIFKFGNIPAESNVVWEVYPREGADLTTGGSIASAMFRKAGSYQVTANFQNAVLKTTVRMNDSV